MEHQIINNLVATLGKVKGIISRLKREAKKQTIDRNECKDILFDLKVNLTMIKQHYIRQIELLEAQQQDIRSSLLLIFFKPYLTQAIGSAVDPLINTTNSLATFKIDNIQYYKDEEIRNRIYDLSNKLEVFIEGMSSQPLLKGSTGISKISELIGEKLAGLDENWMISACYLCAMDVAINKKRRELKLVVDEKEEWKKSFEVRFDELISKLKENQIEISKVIRQLPKAFWRIRTDVVHYGYSPTQDELDLICNWSKNIINAINVRGVEATFFS